MSARLPNPFAPKRQDRIRAFETCIDRGWKAGDEIRSKSWRTTRVIRTVLNGYVQLNESRGREQTRVLAVEFFPKDVSKAESA